MDNTENSPININDFAKIDIRVAKVLEVQEIEGSNKLYKLKVSLGSELGERQILSGIKKFYTPEQLLNRKILIIANLEKAKIMGEISEGMLLAADDAASSAVSLLQCDQDLVEGSRVK